MQRLTMGAGRTRTSAGSNKAPLTDSCSRRKKAGERGEGVALSSLLGASSSTAAAAAAAAALSEVTVAKKTQASAKSLRSMLINALVSQSDTSINGYRRANHKSEPASLAPTGCGRLSLDGAATSSVPNTITREELGCSRLLPAPGAKRAHHRAADGRRRPNTAGAGRAGAHCKALLLALLVALAAGPSAAGSAQNASTPVPARSGHQPSTGSDGKPIKWSFGGWAPVDGDSPSNGSQASTQPMASPSTPRPSTPPEAGAALAPASRQRAPALGQATERRELFSPAPQLRAGRGLPMGHSHGRPHTPLYSQLAPNPVLRQLPARLLAKGWRPGAGAHQPQHRPAMPRQRPLGGLFTQARPQHLAPPAFFRQQLQMHEERLRQGVQQARPRQPQPHSFSPPPYLLLDAEPATGLNYVPISSHLRQQWTNPAAKHERPPVQFIQAHLGGPQTDRIPLLEMSAVRNMSAGEPPRPEAKQVAPAGASGKETDESLNYQAALSRVNGPSGGEPALASLQEATLEQEAAHKSMSRNSYLTIPVAVETDGDRVLTADDISEIEKHVIKVLPSLKTADKLVKMAGAHVSLASGGFTPIVEPVSLGPVLRQLGYQQPQQHLSTPLQQPQQHSETVGYTREPQSTTAAHYSAGSSTGSSRAPVLSSSTTGSGGAASAGRSSRAPASKPVYVAEEGPSYLLADGPQIQQELSANGLEQADLGDIGANHEHLLHQFRYEPTRASGPAAQQQKRAQHQHQQPQQEGSAFTRPMRPRPTPTTHRPTTRGRARPSTDYSPPAANYSTAGAHSYGTASTRHMMDGRRVSDIMRSLIKTTPVPMASAAHVSSLEPEKVDSIQLIAGGMANDRRPVVMEPHQLVNHTPDGGIDYGAHSQAPGEEPPHSSAPAPGSEEQQPQQQQDAVIEYVAMSAMPGSEGQQQQQQQQQQRAGGKRPQEAGSPLEVYMQPMTTAYGDGHTNASPEYHTLEAARESEPALTTPMAHLADGGRGSLAWSPAMGNEQQQRQLEQLSEHYNRPLDMPATAGYNFFTNHNVELPTGSTAAAEPQQAHQHQHQHPEQAEAQHQEPTGEKQEYGQQQQQQQPQQQHDPQQPTNNANWPRTKAGGRQPNPDAQYDGQIAKPEQDSTGQSGHEEHEEPEEHEAAPDSDSDSDSEPNQEQYSPALGGQQFSTTPDMGSHYEEQQQHLSSANTGAPDPSHSDTRYRPYNNASSAGNRYLGRDSEPAGVQADGQGAAYTEPQYHQQAGGQTGSTPDGAGFQAADYSTKSFVGGAQINHSTPPEGAGADQRQRSRHYQHQQHQQHHSRLAQEKPLEYNHYAKLDPERQHNHLRRQQAMHQEQVSQLISGQHLQPATSATDAPIDTTTYSAARPTTPLSEQHNTHAAPQQEALGGPNVDNTINYVVEPVQSTGKPEQFQEQENGGARGHADNQNHHQPMATVIDKQSLISDSDDDSHSRLSDDDAARQRANPKAEPVYQVYQAYYAPKDHKPLPGYVRLSLDQFNKLFRHAEIKYVDKNLRGQKLS